MSIWSISVNRKDSPSQPFWTEWRINAVSVGGTPAQAGNAVLLNADGQIDPSLLPAVSFNGIPVHNLNFNDTTPGAPPGFSDVKWQFDSNGNISAYYATSGVAAVAFGQIIAGTNTGQSLIVGAGSALIVNGSGVIEATELATNTAASVATNTSAPTHAGQLLISQPGNTSAVWADPLVQGLYPDGTPISGGSPPTIINPIYVGGKGTDGSLHGLLTTPSGALVIVSEDTAVAARRFAWDTGPNPVPVPAAVLLPLISIRPKPSAVSITFFLTGFDVFMAPAIGQWQLIKNASLIGASFTDVPNSSTQEDTNATMVSGGIRVDSGYTLNGTRTNTYSLNMQIVGGIPDTYTLVVQKQAGIAKEYASGALRWSEQIQSL